MCFWFLWIFDALLRQHIGAYIASVSQTGNWFKSPTQPANYILPAHVQGHDTLVFIDCSPYIQNYSLF